MVQNNRLQKEKERKQEREAIYKDIRLPLLTEQKFSNIFGGKPETSKISASDCFELRHRNKSELLSLAGRAVWQAREAQNLINTRPPVLWRGSSMRTISGASVRSEMGDGSNRSDADQDGEDKPDW
jgi:hypothetical protein